MSEIDKAMALLYDFQREGVEYLVKHGGGFLWDDPGLGKTRQAIVAAKRLGGPVLVVCPNSLKRWWRTEILNVFPGASVGIAGPGGRFGPRNAWAHQNPVPYWTIVHYAGVRINKYLRMIPWKTVIADECHFIKNRQAERTKAMARLTNEWAFRIGLTATPFGNNPADLWAQLRWMAPYVDGLKSYWKFFEVFVDYDFERRGKQRYKKIKGGRNLTLLAEVMSGYGIRRSKKEVVPDLPPITDTRIPLEMSGKQAAFYRQLKQIANVEITIPADADGPAVRMIIPNALARLIRMEQALSHPWKYMHGVKGAKLEWLMDWINGYPKPAVISTRFKETAHHIADTLHKRNEDLCRSAITGDISVGARDAIAQDWKKGLHQFLVGTIDTIGTGLSFTRAHAMVCFDQLYSAIKMDQVRQRVHRITTDHPVEVLYPYVEGTTNELVLQSFAHRWKQMELVRRFIEHVQSVGNV